MTIEEKTSCWHDIQTKDIYTLHYTPLDMALSEFRHSNNITSLIWLFDGLTGNEPIEELNKSYSNEILFEYGLEHIDKEYIKYFISTILKYKNIKPNTYYGQLEIIAPCQKQKKPKEKWKLKEYLWLFFCFVILIL